MKTRGQLRHACQSTQGGTLVELVMALGIALITVSASVKGYILTSNKADLVVLVSNTTVTVKSGLFNNFASTVTPGEWSQWLKTNVTFTNPREGKTIKTTEIDVDKLRLWSASNTNLWPALGGARCAFPLCGRPAFADRFHGVRRAPEERTGAAAARADGGVAESVVCARTLQCALVSPGDDEHLLDEARGVGGRLDQRAFNGVE